LTLKPDFRYRMTLSTFGVSVSVFCIALTQTRCPARVDKEPGIGTWTLVVATIVGGVVWVLSSFVASNFLTKFTLHHSIWVDAISVLYIIVLTSKSTQSG
jgi:hypothetical protein